MVNLLITLLLAGWIAMIAILSVQNATPVAIQFLSFRSIQIPVGVVLAFSAAIGAIGMAGVQIVFNVTNSNQGELLDDGEQAFDDDFRD